jgi:hypothetical protein
MSSVEMTQIMKLLNKEIKKQSRKGNTFLLITVPEWGEPYSETKVEALMGDLSKRGWSALVMLSCTAVRLEDLGYKCGEVRSVGRLRTMMVCWD